jgi:glucose-1-phosphate cytidylyltransferase|tara:strand:+ start:424 stop:1200 length:777 start_codon:yes stop_codon:yes gene_type:complete
MKVFILCGGHGTRLDNLGKIIAKPMARIGKEPLLLHIIENFCLQGFNNFVICTGHKSITINNFFLREKKHLVKVIKKSKDFTFIEVKLKNKTFRCHIIFTGLNTGTGGRIKIAYNKLKLNEDIIMTYGDGLSNVNIKKLKDFHYKNEALVSLTAVRPKQRYGVIKIRKNKIIAFDETKSIYMESYINGGFFMISKNALKYINSSFTYWENEPLTKIVKKQKVFAFKHKGFWQSIDTLKDLEEINYLFKIKKYFWRFNG